MKPKRGFVFLKTNVILNTIHKDYYRENIINLFLVSNWAISN